MRAPGDFPAAFWVFASAVLAVGLAGAVPAASPAPAPAINPSSHVSAIHALKPGAGRELVQAHCMPCHSTAIIAATHATRERWDELITTMQQKHGLWPLPPTVREPILNYLAATQPPSEPGFDAGKQTPWAGPLYRPNPLW